MRFVTSSDFSVFDSNLKQNKLTYKLLRLFILLWAPLFSQAQIMYSELPDSLRLQIRLQSHLLVNQKMLTDDLLSQVNNQVPIAFKFDGNLNDEQQRLFDQISQLQKQTLVLQEKQVINLEGNSNRILFVNSQKADSFRLSKVEDVDSIDHQKFTANELLILKSETDLLPSDSTIFKLWEQTGKLPNFIHTKSDQIPEIIKIIKLLNSRRKIYGIVHSDNQLVENVSWKEYPGRKTHGYFCFPDKSPLSPYKAGYQFSPDIIFNSPSTWGKLKEFKAIELNPEYLLNDHFSFDKKIENLIFFIIVSNKKVSNKLGAYIITLESYFSHI